MAAVRRYAKEIGHLDWAAPQDWMCEPFILAKTGLSVVEHQRLTIANYLRLKELAPDLPFAPALQGWERADYLACAAMYEAAGVDLAAEPVVGVGSVCRRQATDEIGAIMAALSGLGLRLHGFGVKAEALRPVRCQRRQHGPELPGTAHSRLSTRWSASVGTLGSQLQRVCAGVAARCGAGVRGLPAFRPQAARMIERRAIFDCRGSLTPRRSPGTSRRDRRAPGRGS